MDGTLEPNKHLILDTYTYKLVRLELWDVYYL